MGCITVVYLCCSDIQITSCCPCSICNVIVILDLVELTYTLCMRLISKCLYHKVGIVDGHFIYVFI